MGFYWYFARCAKQGSATLGWGQRQPTRCKILSAGGTKRGTGSAPTLQHLSFARKCLEKKRKILNQTFISSLLYHRYVALNFFIRLLIVLYLDSDVYKGENIYISGSNVLVISS